MLPSLNRSFALAAIAWSIALAGPAPADTVVLKNGAQYDGTITSETRGEVTIHSDGADWTFSREKVASIKRDTRTARMAALHDRMEARRLARLRESTVIMYSTDWCPVCKRAREYFRNHGVVFIDKDIEHDHAAWLELRRKLQANHFRYRGVPVIDIHGHLMDGFSAYRIQRLLAMKR